MPEAKEKLNIPENKNEERLPISELYPDLNPAEQEEAEYFLNRFLEVMLRIFEANQRLTNSLPNTKFKTPK